ncbi:MAG: META domain-containing protein [Novosphingobium sp.]|nr:META domain-containing protein [Novosphingobium sp.]
MKTILAPFALLVLGACATPPPSTAPALAGSQWTFTTIDGATPASGKAHLAFEADRFSANVGCNGMGGPWKIENGRLTAGPVIRTRMYCQGPVWGQEEAVAALLDKGADITVEGNRMTLRSGQHSAELIRDE